MEEMKNLYVIDILDHKDGETSIIGVASSSEKALKMCKEYFGPNYEELSYRDIREGGVEWSRKWKVESYDNSMYECTITVQYFIIDEI